MTDQARVYLGHTIFIIGLILLFLAILMEVHTGKNNFYGIQYKYVGSISASVAAAAFTCMPLSKAGVSSLVVNFTMFLILGIFSFMTPILIENFLEDGFNTASVVTIFIISLVLIVLLYIPFFICKFAIQKINNPLYNNLFS